MNSFIHLLLFAVVAAVLFASSNPTVAAAPAGETAPPEPSEGDDKEILDILLINKNNPFSDGLLRGIGSGVKNILSSVGIGLGGEKSLSKPSNDDDNEDAEDTLNSDKNNPFGDGLLRGIGSGVKNILSGVGAGLGGGKALPKPSNDDDEQDIFDGVPSDKNNPFGKGLLRGIGSGVKSILSGVSNGLGGPKSS